MITPKAVFVGILILALPLGCMTAPKMPDPYECNALDYDLKSLAACENFRNCTFTLEQAEALKGRVVVCSAREPSAEVTPNAPEVF